MRSSIILPLSLFASAGLAQFSDLYARNADLESFDDLDFALQAREAAWDYDEDDLAVMYVRDLLEDEDFVSTILARTVTRQNSAPVTGKETAATKQQVSSSSPNQRNNVVSDLTMYNQKDTAKAANAKADASFGKSLDWMSKSSASNMASHLASERGNTALANKQDARSKFAGALGTHYMNQGMGHAAERNEAQGSARKMEVSGVQRIQRRAFEDEDYYYDF